MSGITKIFIFSIFLNRRIYVTVTKSVYEKIAALSFIYVDESNILNVRLFNDDLHLLQTGKRLLANDFIYTVDIF